MFYLAFLLAGALLAGGARRAPEAVLLPVAAAAIHLAWAAGFFAGALKAPADGGMGVLGEAPGDEARERA